MRMQANYFRLTSLTAVLSLFVFVGCEPAEYDNDVDTQPGVEDEADDVSREIDEAADATGDYLAKKRKEWQRDFDEQMKQWDADMARLNKKAEELKGDAAAEWEEQKPKLEEQRRELAKKMDEAGEVSRETWAEFTKNTQNAWRDLHAELEEAERYFESDETPKEDVKKETNRVPAPAPSDS